MLPSGQVQWHTKNHIFRATVCHKGRKERLASPIVDSQPLDPESWRTKVSDEQGGNDGLAGDGSLARTS